MHTKSIFTYVFVEKTNFQVATEPIVTDLINALPGNSSINTVEHATVEEVVFSIDPTD
jgi:hypothetical protein